MIDIFHKLSNDCSRLTTARYSTSFNSAIRLLHKDLQAPIHNIYGFVRLADEIVDSFHQHDKALLLAEFKKDTWEAIERGISLNPILHSFQSAVHTYNIDPALITSFFTSMEADLNKTKYNVDAYQQYIYGSAEVVGLMCLAVFCEGNRELHSELKAGAQSLGAAFQKVNFLRDLKADYFQLNRSYFPGADLENLTSEMKRSIEKEIEEDFQNAYQSIRRLPVKARFGVYVAYRYYNSLFSKIKRSKPQLLMESRIRIPNYSKVFIILRAGLRTQLNII